MADTKQFIDYEFHFTSGDPLYVTAECDKVTCVRDDRAIELCGTPDTTTTDTITIERSRLNYQRIICRTVEVEPERPEGV